MPPILKNEIQSLELKPSFELLGCSTFESQFLY
jgi:hypothetical protein